MTIPRSNEMCIRDRVQAVLKKAGIVETREGLDGGYPGNAGAVRAWLWSRSMIRFHVAHFVSL